MPDAYEFGRGADLEFSLAPPTLGTNGLQVDGPVQLSSTGLAVAVTLEADGNGNISFLITASGTTYNEAVSLSVVSAFALPAGSLTLSEAIALAAAHGLTPSGQGALNDQVSLGSSLGTSSGSALTLNEALTLVQALALSVSGGSSFQEGLSLASTFAVTQSNAIDVPGTVTMQFGAGLALTATADLQEAITLAASIMDAAEGGVSAQEAINLSVAVLAGVDGGLSLDEAVTLNAALLLTAGEGGQTFFPTDPRFHVRVRAAAREVLLRRKNRTVRLRRRLTTVKVKGQ